VPERLKYREKQSIWLKLFSQFYASQVAPIWNTLFHLITFPNSWTSQATVDNLEPQIEVRSIASGLTPHRRLWRQFQISAILNKSHTFILRA
jgi:hypothetical protein